jgi:hypothetical protein
MSSIPNTRKTKTKQKPHNNNNNKRNFRNTLDGDKETL